MQIEITTVQKLMITNIAHLDPVAVYLEDCGPGRGKITITCFDDSWTNFWGAMGTGRTIRDFFIGCDNGYLCNKFAPGVHSTIYDRDGIVTFARKEILKQRRAEWIHASIGMTKTEARELYDEAGDLDDAEDSNHLDANIMCRIFGDEWWHSNLPQKPNHKYDYLCRILDAVKAALVMDREAKAYDAALDAGE